jgi:hypothetical protein
MPASGRRTSYDVVFTMGPYREAAFIPPSPAPPRRAPVVSSDEEDELTPPVTMVASEREPEPPEWARRWSGIAIPLFIMAQAASAILWAPWLTVRGMAPSGIIFGLAPGAVFALAFAVERIRARAKRLAG